MTWTAESVDRTDPPVIADERAMAHAWLDYHRQTLLTKCAGLDRQQLRQRSATPSKLSLLGLVRHMSEVERWWFRQQVGAEAVTPVYCTEESEDEDFDGVDTADPAADFDIFRRECGLADEAARHKPLDYTFTHTLRGYEMSLRWVYHHMIEEYARHNGHADILRERIDGATGE